MTELNQRATETCITAMLIDLTRYFRRFASIDNVGDKRYWEERIKYTGKQYTESSNSIKIDFSGNLSVDQSQNTAPTEINYNFIDSDKEIKSISVTAKRRTVTIPFNCKINLDTFIQLLSVTEELIDKTASARTFNYVLFGKMFSANYRLNYDATTESKTNFSATENSDNGYDLSFTLVLEFQYYAPTYKAKAVMDYVTINRTITQLIPTGVMIPSLDDSGQPIIDDSGNQVYEPETTEVETIVPVIVASDLNVLDADQNIITKLVSNIYLINGNG